MKTIIITILAIFTLAATYFAAQEAIRYQAIDGCLHAGTDRFKNSAGQDAQVPDGYWYQFCMKEKGLK
ncbi:MAG: hypothetical protein M1277_01625 [Patescibacteria group bacterium]|nr:hypothetical protein [Patescibacteria group bacterium]